MKQTIGAVMAIWVLLWVGTAAAHPGKLDEKGGHYCRENCEQFGLKKGEYHTHKKVDPVSAETTVVPVPAETTAAPRESAAAPRSETSFPSVPPSLWVLLAIVVGVPVLAVWWLWRLIKKIILRVKNRGHDL